MKNFLPNDTNWDSFWSDNIDSSFTKLSWSKKRIIKILDKYIKKDMVVLDAGCGSGFFSKYFLDRGCEVFALDYSQKALDVARKLTKGKANYISGDLLNQSFCKKYINKFDLVFSDGLFEHFLHRDQIKIMQNFKLMKKKNGLIVTFVPNKFSLWEVIRPIFMPQIKENPFVLGGLYELAKKTDSKIIKSGGLNVLPMNVSPEFIGKYIGMLLYLVSK